MSKDTSTLFKTENQPQHFVVMEDAPCEKASIRGTSSLTNSELLSAIIGANSATSFEIAKLIMIRYNNSFVSLCKATISELQTIKGVTRVAASRIACALELNKRKACEVVYDKTYRSSVEIANYLRTMIANETREHFYVLCMNRANKITHSQCVSIGGITGTVADPRVILKLALEYGATSIVLSHNHPSGNLKPSKADEDMTMKIKMAASYMDINVLDHIIVSTEGYFSFAEEGLI